MSDIDDVLQALHWLPIQDRYDKPHPIYPGKKGLNDEHIEEAKQDLLNLILKALPGKIEWKDDKSFVSGTQWGWNQYADEAEEAIRKVLG